MGNLIRANTYVQQVVGLPRSASDRESRKRSPGRKQNSTWLTDDRGKELPRHSQVFAIAV
jgi:hypothetical protein